MDFNGDFNIIRILSLNTFGVEGIERIGLHPVHILLGSMTLFSKRIINTLNNTYKRFNSSHIPCDPEIIENNLQLP